MKRIISFMLCFLMVISLVACSSGGNGDKKPTATKVDTSLKKSEPAAAGDVFKLPDVKQAAGAPVLAELTKQAYPGDSIMVGGEGFKGAGVKFYVYAQTKKDNGKAYEAKFTVVDDTYASVLIDEKLDYGMYGIYAENASGTSNIKTVNKPAIWTEGFNKLCAGESLTLLGENLSTKNGNKSHAFLVSEDGKEHCEAPISFAAPGKVELIMPEGLNVGTKYKVLVHNGHGGKEGFVEAPKMVEYLKETAVQFNGKVVDVTKYGADAYDAVNDDTKAIKKAVKKLDDGDILYFPPGSYLVTETISILKDIKLLGAGADKVTIYAGYNIEGSVIKMTGGYAEVTGITIEQNRSKGKIKANLLSYSSNAIDEGKCRFYVHDNAFIQSVTAKSRSFDQVLSVSGTYGVRVENNKFDAPAIFYAGRCKQVYFKNNEAAVTMLGGIYYGSNTVFLTNIDGFDGSFNKIYGKGADKKTGSGVVNVDDYIGGRVFVFQGFARNTYVCNNELVRVGLTSVGAGELVLFEQFDWLYYGNIAKSTADTVEVTQNDRNKTVVNSVISILKGKGKGQYRLVTKRAGNTFTVDKPWDIIPDTTSLVVVTNTYFNSMVCDNYMDGYENWASKYSATVALSVYGPFQNIFFCRNKVKNVISLAQVTSFYWFYDMYDIIAPVSWNQFDRNVTEKSGVGLDCIFVTNENSGEIPHELMFGNTFRRNEFKDILNYKQEGYTGGYAIMVGSPQNGRKWVGEWCIANIFESNTFENSENGNILLGPHQGHNIFRNNTENGKNTAIKIEKPGYGTPIEATY